jgi:hypothetical protein
MRFLRRGGRDELQVEVEDAPVDETEGDGNEPDGAVEAIAQPADAAAEPEPAAEREPEPDDVAAAEPEGQATAEPDDAAAEPAPEVDGTGDADPVEPDDAVAAKPEVSADANAEPDDEVPTQPGEAVAAATEGEDVQADDEAAAADTATDDDTAVAESDAEPAETAPASSDAPEANDEEGLAGLVSGVARPSAQPSASADERSDDTRPEVVRQPALAFLIADDPSPDPLADGRPAGLRLASLHLHTGQHALARAELEAFAGRGRLDESALLDLAEVRWRMGDLSGAGEAANALLARGTEVPLALVIAAESVAAAGRPTEARRLSARALEVVDGPLDPLFAGMPRAMIWPTAATPEPSSGAPRRRGRRAKGEAEGAPSTAAEAFAGGRAALAKGDTSRAALLLGVAMRLEPGFAEDVLRAVAGRDDQPLLALVRGDALRLLGREAEALAAFDRARGRSSGTATGPDEPTGPGLFDDDPG